MFLAPRIGGYTAPFMAMMKDTTATALRRGLVIPAHPLALNGARRMDEYRQAALTRYYIDAGAGGLAVGVHTTQFAIRDPAVGLYEPVLALAAAVMNDSDACRPVPLARIAGVCGSTSQALREASTAESLGYHAALLNLGALAGDGDAALIAHCRAIAEVMPLFGFYLQPAAGGRVLGHGFWRTFAEIENVVAIKIAAFDRYRTLDVVRAIAESGRHDIALYTGNDDNIINDLLTTYRFTLSGRVVERRMVGGLLGQWAVWTKRAVELLESIHQAVASGVVPAELLTRNAELTDANGALFDAANGFAGCISGIHEALRRQGLLDGIWCLNERETLSPGQLEQIDRIHQAYPHLRDDAFITGRRDRE